MTKRQKINYAEGDCFTFPVRGGGFARGVVARLDGRGVVLGYFFGPKLSGPDDAQVTDDLRPGNAILVKMFGDLGLLKGEWRIIDKVGLWSRGEWPLLPFRHKYEDARETVLRYYDEETLAFSYETKTSEDDAARFPCDGLSGYGAIEIRMARLLV